MKHTETRARQTGPAVLLHQTQIGRSTTELLALAPTLFSLTTCSTCNTDTHFYNSIGKGGVTGPDAPKIQALPELG